MENFTPILSLFGGLIIGSSVVLYFYTTGRLAGISGIFANGLTVKKNKSSNLLFLLGLIVGPSIYLLISNQEITFNVTNSFFLIIVAGFFVGLGTRMSSGCTSGHGICGISRFSTRSIIATISFVITGVITVFALQQFGFYL
ncbi:YeeE/YedE thiosulfate transporter family protein [Alphaproteobacteria bacterium]|nr:YeeE/YedE thiosulfate transporter family protein [Alphaproteobacteria bacterium]MDC1060211.1 YeeE/YedE thiosulfate transporter family protein [Alphaproteobacteria bacterium]